MLVLALESSTELASCALWRDGQVDQHSCELGIASSSALLPAAGKLLAKAALTLHDIDAIAFGAGPGSFTGVRIACSLAQGLAFAANLPVLAVNTLAAVAEASGDDEVLAVLDARMREVYWGRFKRVGDAWLDVDRVAVVAPDSVPIPGNGVSVCGNALIAYPELAARMRGAYRLRPEIIPTAAAVATIGARLFAAGAGIAAAAAVPLYVRDKVAQTVAERLAAGGRA